MLRKGVIFTILWLMCLLFCPSVWADDCVVDTLAKDLRYSASQGDEHVVLVEPKTEMDSLLFYPAADAQLAMMPVALFSFACADMTDAEALAMTMVFADCRMAYQFALPAMDEEQEFFLSLQAGAEGDWFVGRVGEKEIVQDTTINRDTTDIQDTTIIDTPKMLDSLRLEPRDVVLSLEQMSQTFSVAVFPEDAEDAEYEIRLNDPYSLTEFNHLTMTLTAKYGKNGGKVTLTAFAKNNRLIADTIEISIKPTVERTDAFLSVESWGNVQELGKQDTAYLSVWLYPQGSQSEPVRPASVSYRVLQGAHLVEITDKLVEGKGLAVCAKPGNEGGTALIEGATRFYTGNSYIRLADTIEMTVLSQYIDMESILLSTEGGDTCLYLGSKNHTIRVLAQVLPDNASGKSLNWTIVEGYSLAEFDEQTGRLRLRQTASSLEDTSVVLRARDASYRTEVYADLHIYVSVAEGLGSTSTDGISRRLVMMDGQVLVEVRNADEVRYFDMVGRAVMR